MTLAKEINIFIITDEDTKKELSELLLKLKEDKNLFKDLRKKLK